jgi:phosphoglycerate dehydrogenase-like enzyme
VKDLAGPRLYEAGIIVTHAADANSVPVAEFTLAAIIFANKRASSCAISTAPTIRAVWPRP